MDRKQDSARQDWNRAAVVGGATYFVLFATAVSLFELVSRLVALPGFAGAPGIDIQEPILVVTCWIAAMGAASANEVALHPRPRLLMGATGFVLLLIAEAYVSLVIENDSPAALVRDFTSTDGVLRLFGYVGFGLAPLLQIWLRLQVPDERRNDAPSIHHRTADPR